MKRTPREYFERLYHHDGDPWGFGSRWYEQRKYQLTLAALPRARYRSAYEPGCSIGVLSELLAARCDHVLASEQVASVAARAATRLETAVDVTVECHCVPEHWPAGPFDLVVLSEIAYYFDEVGAAALTARAVETLEAGGTLIAVHWRGATDYPLRGDAAHEVIGAASALRHVVAHCEPEFRLDVWERRPDRNDD